VFTSPFSNRAGLHQPERRAGGVDQHLEPRPRLVFAACDLDIETPRGVAPEHNAALLRPVERSATDRPRSSLPVSFAPAI
jgi:hypothetical protein